jgi:hypothetical protein
MTRSRAYFIPSVVLALAWGRAQRRRARGEDCCRPEVRYFQFWVRFDTLMSRMAAKLTGIMR